MGMELSAVTGVLVRNPGDVQGSPESGGKDRGVAVNTVLLWGIHLLLRFRKPTKMEIWVTSRYTRQALCRFRGENSRHQWKDIVSSSSLIAS